jgi:hypothetical protein
MNSYTYSPLESALEKLTIYDVWHLLGLEGRSGKACRSPFRQDRNPSFSVYSEGRRWHDHGTGEDGDAADFCAKARGLSQEDGVRLLIELAGTKSEGPAYYSKPRQASHYKAESYDPFKDEEKARRREGWPPFESPTSVEIEAIATLRGLSPEGVAIAAERRLLFCADSREGRAWIITDSRRINAQARRMDGNPWECKNAKAWSLPGSVGAWPTGLREAQDFPHIAFVEGGPDLLAAFHLAWCVSVEGSLGVVAMLGRHAIPESKLRHFQGKRVRIFADADEPGLEAEGRWWHQLEKAGAIVDGYSFAGFLRSDGKPVKDLNDFALIDPDQWEVQGDAIEEAFAF